MSHRITKSEILLTRFHPVLYISIAALVTAFVVFSYFNTYLKSEDPSTSIQAIDFNFNKETVEKVKSLQTAGNPSNEVALPDTRYNPFVVK